MDINNELFRKAFKKLKSSVYYDKTALVLRNKLVEYEMSAGDNINSRLDDIFDICTGSDGKYEEFCEKILSSINYLAFPKKIESSDPEDEIADADSVLYNFADEKTKLTELQFFIDMAVEGHILGVVWLMLIGYRIDKDVIYNHSYGNRIRKKLINDLSNEVTYSPYLFEPYFQQYESWCDEGMKKALDCLDENLDVIIMTMDFKRFYYSVDMNKDAFDAVYRDASIPKDNESIIYEQMNSFVCKVVEKYASLFKQENERKKCILPIGFLPSNVLANWCLRNFDKVVIDGWNPVYYGRYVDDILIVDKVEHNCELYKRAQESNITKSEIVEIFLRKFTRWSGVYNTKESDKECRKFAPLIQENENNECVYKVSNLYTPLENDNSCIRLQNKKLKVFYFKSNETKALITCFKDEISKNKSEFRYMPEDDAVFSDNDYGEIYNLNYKDTINKFRGIEGLSVDSYKLSKFLGKYLRIGSLIKDKSESNFAKDILKVFDNRIIIQNHIQWEKIIEILVINKHYEAAKKFIKRIVNAVKNISLELDVESKASTDEVVTALLLELDSAVIRVFSLVYNKETQELINYIYSDENGIKLRTEINENRSETAGHIFDEVLEMRKGYNKTRMSDKSVMPIMIDMIDDTAIDLTDFDAAFKNIKKNVDFLVESYVYYPYLINMHDIALMAFLSEIKSEKGFSDFKILHKNEHEYLWLNYRLQGKGDFPVKVSRIKGIDPPSYSLFINGGKKHKLKIAVANTKLSVDNFTSLVKGVPCRGYERYCAFSRMVNQSLKEKADILVLPESYLPFEWLPLLSRICAANQMAVVTGIEHIINDKYVYNFTAVILPYIDNDIKCASISFHLKRHYAPFEERLIRGYGFEPVQGKSYELYKWNDCYFPVYCCYELTSIKDRGLFESYADFIIAVEWNHDVNYYSNIIGSLSRDTHCYCIQVNTSDYGDSRITKPSKTEMMDILRTKGGANSTVLIGEIDIEKLRDFQIKQYELQNDDKSFKPTPPEFKKDIVRKKIIGDDRLFEEEN